jgi:hypothetical protein
MQEHNTVTVGLGRTVAWVATMVHDHGRVRRVAKGAKHGTTGHGAAEDERGQGGARYSMARAWRGWGGPWRSKGGAVYRAYGEIEKKCYVCNQWRWWINFPNSMKMYKTSIFRAPLE